MVVTEQSSTHYFEDAGKQPAYLERAERLWLRLSVVVLLFFLAGVGVVTWFGFQALPQAHGPGYDGPPFSTPDKLLASAAFATPGTIVRGDGSVDAYLVGRIWEWRPAQVRVPRSKPIRFHLTLADVLHGFRIIDTPVNVMVMPGMVASATFSFARAGTYRIVCTEYCGVNHQNMVSTIVVKDAR